MIVSYCVFVSAMAVLLLVQQRFQMIKIIVTLREIVEFASGSHGRTLFRCRFSRLLMFLVKFPDFIQMVDTACVPALQDFVGILETWVLRLGQCAAARLQNDIQK